MSAIDRAMPYSLSAAELKSLIMEEGPSPSVSVKPEAEQIDVTPKDLEGQIEAAILDRAKSTTPKDFLELVKSVFESEGEESKWRILTKCAVHQRCDYLRSLIENYPTIDLRHQNRDGKTLL